MSDLFRLIAAGDGNGWKDVVKRLRRINRDDHPNVQARADVAELYARYMINSNELTVCHDFIIQPQVRILIKKMLMCVYGRILELKKFLIDEDLSIHTPIIEQLATLRMTYEEFELIVPRCFRDERRSFLIDIDDKIDEICRRTATVTNETDVVNSEEPTGSSAVGQSISRESSDPDYDVTKFIHNEKKSMPQRFNLNIDEKIARETALKLIQRHIRAMRDRAIVNEILSAQRTRESIISGKYINPSKEKARRAVVKIQRYWRFYRIMRRTKVRTQKLHVLIGMHKPSDKRNYDDDVREREDKTRVRQAIAETDLRNVTDKLQKSLNQRHKAEIIEEMEHELRTYVWTYFKTHKSLPPVLDPSADSKPEKIVTKTAVKTRQQAKRTALVAVVPEPSEFTAELAKLFKEFDRNWTTDNGLDERPREELIRSEIFANIREENKDMINKTITKELERLKRALARDMGKKYRAPKRKTKKSSRARSKKSKYPNPEEIFEELVNNGMIKKSVTSEFRQFQGEVSYCTSTLVAERYCLGDIRQIIKELFVIGLISPELRALKKLKFMKSLLIVGPNKSGKTLLVNAVCTETGSLKIELTLKNVSENYTTVKDINRLVDFIIEFSRTYQPIVIEVDLADIPFYKKISKDLKLLYKPALMVKLMKQLMKKLKETERVIIIGKATTPWLTNARRLTNVYQAIVFTVPDYNSVFTFVNNLLMSYPWVSREFPVSPLASLLADHSRHAIADVMAKIMTAERMLTLRHRPLTYKEFVPTVLKTAKQLGTRDQYHGWYTKYVPLGVAKKLDTEKQEKQKNEMKTRKPAMKKK